ncbi:MAG: hypothetical protein QOG20_1719 [Pseudonocardiales bacterium]|nr:hypothetical protein [Pseudonocardiales bacterium]
MSPLQHYTRRIARRWVLILAVAMIGGVLATMWAHTRDGPTWTATAALTAQSQLHSPDQDAVLALGYVDYFNQPSYQQLLATEVHIPAGVKLSAATAATSPVLYIEASGTDEASVRSAAAVAAETFRNDVRQSLVAENQRVATGLQTQVANSLQQLQQPGVTPGESNVILDQIRSLQGQITVVQADDTNQLKQLQPVPGVASTKSSTTVAAATGLAGGAVLGILIALLFSALDNRLRTPADVRQHLRLDTLANFEANADPVQRTRRVQAMANAMSLFTRSGPTVVAVVAPRGGRTSAAFARELAGIWSTRRAGTLLILANLRSTESVRRYGVRGLVNVLDGETSVVGATVTERRGLRVLPSGDPGGRDPYVVVEPDRLVEVIEEASKSYGLVIIDAPPVDDAAESQVVCAVADHVLVVVESGVTTAKDAVEAVALLNAVNTRVAGVVIDQQAGAAEAQACVDGAADDDSLPTRVLKHVHLRPRRRVAVLRLRRGASAEPTAVDMVKATRPRPAPAGAGAPVLNGERASAPGTDKGQPSPFPRPRKGVAGTEHGADVPEQVMDRSWSGR